MTSTLLLSLLSSLLTATQVLFILFSGDGLCFSNGCRIVDSLTTVPPLAFNLMGLLFFQAIFWGVWLDRRRAGRFTPAVKILLLAGMASEGVLVSFQYYITEIFCAYCLVILACIVLLNITFGFRQMASGLLIFAAVLMAFSSLQFYNPLSQSEESTLEKGTYGMRHASGAGPELFLFFSSSCLHCENIIETLKRRNACTIRFQPVDEIRDLDFPGLQKAPDSSFAVNRKLLKSLGLEEVPVLLAKDAGGIQILKGEGSIRAYLERNCPVDRAADSAVSGSSTVGGGFLPTGEEDGSCSAFEVCEEPSLPKDGN
jgi:uncharacterized membrane protein